MDAYQHCGDLVRERDRDLYLADLLAPAAARPYLFALHAFDSEIARIRDAVSEPMLGEIRLQWWRDAVQSDAGGHPVATALKETIARFSLPLSAFDNLLAARAFDLYDDPMPSLASLEGYAGDTTAALMQLSAIVLAEGRDPGTGTLAGYAGVAVALTEKLRSLPRDASRGQCFLPADLMQKHGVAAAEIFAGRATPSVRAVVSDLRARARDCLGAARGLLGETDKALLPAFLPAALVDVRLKAMERPAFDPLHPTVGLSPLRRQWILWRAARRGRI